MTNRLRPQVAIEEFTTGPIDFLKKAVVGEDIIETPRTDAFIVTLIIFFLAQILLWLQTNAGSPQDIVAFFFIYSPEIAWPLAPLLHRGIFHFTVNIAVLYIASPVENDLKRSEYLLLLFTSGYLPVYFDGVKLYLFGNTQHVAAYGASAFAFGLVGFGLTSLLSERKKLTPREWLIVVFGIAGIVEIVINIITAINQPVSLKVGHLGGMLIGVCFSYIKNQR